MPVHRPLRAPLGPPPARPQPALFFVSRRSPAPQHASCVITGGVVQGVWRALPRGRMRACARNLVGSALSAHRGRELSDELRLALCRRLLLPLFHPARHGVRVRPGGIRVKLGAAPQLQACGDADCQRNGCEGRRRRFAKRQLRSRAGPEREPGRGACSPASPPRACHRRCGFNRNSLTRLSLIMEFVHFLRECNEGYFAGSVAGNAGRLPCTPQLVGRYRLWTAALPHD
jgi:hypothetical protein